MTTVNVSLVRQVEAAVSLRGPAGAPGPAGGIPIYAVDPVSPTDGLVYYNSTSGTVRYYTNAEGWQQLLEAGDNAVSATRWETARTLLLDGDASGSVVLDGSADVTLTVTVPELADKADTASLGSAAFAATTDFDPAGSAAAAQAAAEATAAGGLAAHHSPTSTDHDDRYTPTANLADVATSGAYSDLSGAPTLGSAAATDAADYATAAQGAKADNAVQLTGETTQQVEGNLEVLGGLSAGYGQELSAPGPGRISTGGDLDVAGHADVGDYLNANEVHAYNDMTLDGNRVAIEGHDHNGENLYPQTVDASIHIQLQGQDVVVQPQLTAHHAPTSADHDDRYTPTSQLADVATSGDYTDLDNTPVLGTAAATDAGDYATAAQGAKADSASQPGHTHLEYEADGAAAAAMAAHEGDVNPHSQYAPVGHDHDGDYDPAGAASAAVAGHEASHAPADAITAAQHALIDHTGLPGVGAGGGGIEEAPVDGTPYARQDAGWVAVEAGGDPNALPVWASDGEYTDEPVYYNGIVWFAAGTPPVGIAPTVYASVDTDTETTGNHNISGAKSIQVVDGVRWTHNYPVMTTAGCEVDDPAYGSWNGTDTVWYVFRPSSDGTIDVDTQRSTGNSTRDTAIWLYTANGHPSGYGDLTDVPKAGNGTYEGNGDPAFLAYWVDIPVVAGQTYYLEIGNAANRACDLVLDVTPAGTDLVVPEGAYSWSHRSATPAQGALADTAVQPGDLATVATTGAYSDLSGTPTLGTAADNDEGDFATAAQGALADTAVQPADLDARVPDPSGEADGRMLEVASGALVYADAPSGGGSGPDPTGATAGHVWTADGADGADWAAPSGGGSGHTIQDEGVPVTQRDTINFVGDGVTVTDSPILAPAEYTAAVVADAPELWFRFTETSGTTAEDETANNRDGTYEGSPTLDQVGPVVKAISLDGTDDQVTFPANSAWSPGAGDMSVECWYKGTDVGVAGAINDAGQAVIASANTDTNNKWWLLSIDENGYITGWNNNGPTETPSTAVVNDDEWHHIVFTIDYIGSTTQTTRLYLDGVQVGGYNNGGGSGHNGSPTHIIGRNGRQADSRISGSVAEFALYGEVLTPERVTAHYEAATTSGEGTTVVTIPSGGGSGPDPTGVPDGHIWIADGLGEAEWANPTYRPASTPTVVFYNGYRASTTPITVSIDAATQAGDILVIVAQTNGAQTITTPAGWTVQSADHNSAGWDQRSYIFTRTATEGDAGTTVDVLSGGSTVNFAVSIIGVRGVYLGAVEKTIHEAGVPSTFDTPTPDAAVGDSVLHVWSVQSSNSTAGLANYTSMDVELDEYVTFTGSDPYARIFIGYEQLSGAPAARNAVWSSSAGVTSYAITLAAPSTLVDWVVDEDDMASDTDLAVPTQQSVKAYVDSNTQHQVDPTGATLNYVWTADGEGGAEWRPTGGLVEVGIGSPYQIGPTVMGGAVGASIVLDAYTSDVQAGDMIVVYRSVTNPGAVASAPTASGLTFTSHSNVGTVSLWTAISPDDTPRQVTIPGQNASSAVLSVWRGVAAVEAVTRIDIPSSATPATTASAPVTNGGVAVLGLVAPSYPSASVLAPSAPWDSVGSYQLTGWHGVGVASTEVADGEAIPASAWTCDPASATYAVRAVLTSSGGTQLVQQPWLTSGDVDSGAATAGQVLTADGDGGADWAAPLPSGATDGDVLTAIQTPVTAVPFSGTGTNGLVDYARTNTLTITTASSSVLDGSSGHANAVDGALTTDFATTDTADSWWTMQYVGYTVKATRVAIRGRNSSAFDQLKNFVVEGSNNGTDWTVLVVSDTALSQGVWTSYSVGDSGAYEYFRVRGTGLNSDGRNYVIFSEFEVYGSLYDNGSSEVSLTWAAPSGGGVALPLFGMAGDLSVGVGDTRWYNDTGATINLTTVRATVVTAPVGADLIVSLAVDGVEADTVTVADGATTAKETVTVAIPADSYLTVDITQVGSTTAGADLLVTMTGA